MHDMFNFSSCKGSLQAGAVLCEKKKKKGSDAVHEEVKGEKLFIRNCTIDIFNFSYYIFQLHSLIRIHMARSQLESGAGRHEKTKSYKFVKRVAMNVIERRTIDDFVKEDLNIFQV